MAQNDQNLATEETGLQLHIPGMEQFKDLEFIQSENNPTDLIVQLPDGSEVVFPNYIPLAEAGAPPAITLDDGTVVPGQEIVSLIENLDYDLIAPAAGNDTVGPVTGGGAGFLADPSGLLGDDIGHGPYAGGIQISDDVGFEQLPGDTGNDGSGGSGGGGGGGETETPVILAANNVGDTFGLMEETSVGLADRPSSGAFGIELETIALNSPRADWDGMRVWLQDGETITITHDDSAAIDYYIALETDPTGPVNGYDPLYTLNYTSLFPPIQLGTSADLDWEFVNLDGSISYTATGDGWVYIGTGYESYTATGSYYTDILIEADDGVLTGTSSNDILVGGTLDDVITGGAGDDQITGGVGSDQFRFESVADGHDTITDFTAGGGGDVINLDALFDALAIAPGAREAAVSLSNDGTDTTLGIAAHPEFSVVMEGILLSGAGDVNTLITNGNLVVDES